MFFIEDLATLVLWLLALVVSLNLVFFLFVLYRRFSRQRFYAEKDAAREGATEVRLPTFEAVMARETLEEHAEAA